MNEDEHMENDATAREGADRDALGALIRAAGRRPMPSREDYERVLASSRAAWLQQVHARQRRRRLAALAASLLIVVVGVLTLSPRTPLAPAAVATVLQGTVEVARDAGGAWEPLTEIGTMLSPGVALRTSGGGAAFALAPGVQLRVAEATELEFIAADRIEMRAGTIYVDSGTGVRTTGMAIETDLGTVREIGTQFEVHAAPATVRVRVREGRVRLLGFAADRPVEGAAGEELAVGISGEVRRGSIAPDDAQWTWVQQLAEPMSVDGRSAHHVLTAVARELGLRLQFADAGAELRARNAILSGGGEGLAPTEALEVAIATSADLDYSVDDGVLLVRRRR